MLNLIEYDSFKKLSQERGSSFNLYFVWPTFSKSINEALSRLPSEVVGKHSFRIWLNDDNKLTTKDLMLFGIDLLLEIARGDEYAVVFGVINKSSWRDLIRAQQLLRSLGFNTVPARSDSLFQFLMNQENYTGYLLKEYRSGATKLQSYFKDDNVDEDSRLIYERLENDWKDGLRPYKATLRKPGSSIKIQIDGRGIITMPIVPEDTEVLNTLIQKMIEDHRIIRKTVNRAKLEKLEIRNLQLFGHSNLVVKLRVPTKVSHVDSNEDSLMGDDTVDNFIGYLEESAGVYGKSIDKESCSFNLLYDDAYPTNESKFTSSFSVDIRLGKILVSPTFQPQLQDLLHLYFGIDKYFQIEQET